MGKEPIKTESEIEVFSRYEALGIPLPDPQTMCEGECEGIGVVPVRFDDLTEPWHTLWLEAEAKEPTDDGWHFVKCPDCKGTGKKPIKAENSEV